MAAQELFPSLPQNSQVGSFCARQGLNWRQVSYTSWPPMGTGGWEVQYKSVCWEGMDSPYAWPSGSCNPGSRSLFQRGCLILWFFFFLRGGNYRQRCQVVTGHLLGHSECPKSLPSGEESLSNPTPYLFFYSPSPHSPALILCIYSAWYSAWLTSFLQTRVILLLTSSPDCTEQVSGAN